MLPRMAFLDCHFFSESLGLSTALYAILPQPAAGQIGVRERRTGGRCPVLYLLHGLSDDHTIWMRRTSVERYATEKGMAVIMPAAARSMYQDMASGPRYWTFVSEELPRLVRHFFPVSHRREDTFVAGLSMGGYGAFRLALARPGRFAAAASFSGALDLGARLRAGLFSPAEQAGVFGHHPVVTESDADLFFLARRLAASGRPVPRLYQYCGDRDFLWQDNLRFRRLARRLRLPLAWRQDHGDHSWPHWDQQIRQALDWFRPA
jgi:S-formylglutathione hydrolase FrmB